ncbi:hypothetical protein [Fimbriimonas ginsengisoli]|uniref:hypothetical protein n=1 Tax=Fimbriimonas ginsengisoli TaxID=1005039 RepID=UPI00118682F7|nr:hypothetical protein [Fimbriimonas ginsengisoli]
MRPDQEVVLDYRSRGCFRNVAFVFHFQRQPGTDGLKATVLRRPGQRFGSVDLNRRQVRRLDHLLKYYREHDRGNCTTVDTIRVELRERGVTVRTESFVSAQCSLYDTPEICRQKKVPYPDLLPPMSIVEAARKKEAKQPR